MSLLLIDDLTRYSDTLRTGRGDVLNLRFVEPRDTEELQHYVRSLSMRSRYNRFFGAISELPTRLLNDFLQVGAHDRFSIVATMPVDGFDSIVAEARYALHEANLHAASPTLEFGLSVADRWQGHGIAAALLDNLECRAAALGAESMFGDTLRSNEAMIGLARKSGFALVSHPDDWNLVRFRKDIVMAPADIPCASWRLAALSRQAASPSASA